MAAAPHDVPGIAIVHLMKTGGTSIGRALSSQFEPSECYPRRGEAARSRGQKVNPDQLLDLPDEERASLRFVSVHMPAWVVGAAVPHLPTATMLRHPVDRSISHLRQIARTNRTGSTLDELWAHPPIRRRLANYQTQVFAAESSSYDRRPRSSELPTDLTEHQKTTLIDELIAAKETGLDQPVELDERSFATAIERLDTIDIVGTTNDLVGFSTRLAERTGLPLATLGHENQATDNETADSELRRRIAADNELDLALYEYAEGLLA